MLLNYIKLFLINILVSNIFNTIKIKYNLKMTKK